MGGSQRHLLLKNNVKEVDRTEEKKTGFINIPLGSVVQQSGYL